MRNILKLILVLVFTNIVVAQNEPNDCVNAIIICGNGSFTSNASGSGSTQEINACGGMEINSLWLKINIVQGGTLGFNLIPDDPSITVDYDFWVFGPNPNCAALGVPIRCATTNPQEAGLTNNITGMIGSTLLTQTGPGSDGNGFVRWLNVLPGQSYYIAIDRPAGDGGFQIQWTGSAMSGTGAFTTPPTVNSIADVLTCSNTPNVGIYNLDTVRTLINPDTSSNTISFHTSLEEAHDNTNPLPDIYANTSNPQTIFVRVTNNASGCYSTTDFDLVVNLVPNASIAVSSNEICNGDAVTVTFSGTPNATFDYNVNGGPTLTNTLNASGLYNIVYTPTTNTTFTLTNVRILDGSGNIICSQPLNQAITVTVNPIPTANISGTTSICSGATTVVTFTGTPDAIVTYTVDGGSNQTIVLDNAGSAVLTTPALTLDSTYTLVNVFLSGTFPCSQSITGSAVITIGSLPTVSISGTTTVCSGATTPITFTGTPNATVTYTVDSGSNQTILLDGTGSAILTTPVLTTNSTYDLISASLPGTPPCIQSQTGSVSIFISSLPTASISGTTTICSGETAQITFSGTPNAIVTYTINGGSNQTIVLDGTGSAILTTSALTATRTYDLVSVSLSGTPPCGQTLVGSAVVNVLPMPTASISGTTSICSGSSSIISFNGTPNATITYTINGGANQTVTTNSVGTVDITTGPLTLNAIYDLVSIIDNSGIVPACTRALSGNAVVTVNSIPVITNALPNQIVCSDDIVITNPFVSLPSGATFTWTNTNPAIGLPSSGNGNIPNFTANNNTNTAISATIDVLATSNGCSSSQSFVITVHPRPFANPTISDYALCDYTNPGDGEEVFTLNSKTAEIINGQVGLTVSYYLTQQDAEDQINPLPNLYTNTTIGAPQTIWINIRNVTTGCNSVSSFNIVVNPLPVAVTPLAIFECSIGTSTTQAEFDLTVNENVTTAGATGVTVTYYLSLSDAQTPVNAIPSPTTFLGNDGQTIYIRVEYTATGCYSTTTQLLRVTEGPTANVPQPLNYCDPNNDGFGVFDLDSTITAITGGQAGVTVTFHETQDDANIGANAKSSPYSNIVINQQTIYVRVFYTTTGCSNFVELKLIVNPTPEATVPNDLHLCDYTGAVGYEPFDLTLVIPEVLGSINPTTHVVTFYDDPTNAQQGINNITSTSGYINGTINQETIYVRVETIATGCFDIVDFDIIVDPLPLITRPNYPQYSVCDLDQSEIGYEIFDLNSKVADILLGQTGMEVTFYPSISNAEDNINAITNLNYENEDQYVQTLGIRITNTTTKCYVVSSIDIRVEPLPSPIPPLEPYTVCDDDQDGVSCGFDLTTLVADLVQSANYTITFHETQVNANRGENAINTTINYCNIRAYVQTLYVRAVDNLTGCWSTLPIELNVNPSPSAPVNVPNIEVCDTDTNTQNAITNVNLVPQTAIVLAQQPLPATSYIVTYHTNPTDAATGDDEIVNTTSYSATNGQTIWVRLENIATGCYNVGSFQVIIDIPLIVATPTPINECDDDANPNDQFTNFDLTVRNIAPANHSLNYYPSLAQAQSNSDEITNITNYTNDPLYPAVQTLGVKITTPAGCISYTTLDIRVLPIPEPLDPSSATPELVLPAVCENAPNSGQQTLDLTINEAYIRNGETTLVLHYFPTLTDLENNTNELLTPNAALVGDTTLTGDPIDLVQYVYIAVSSPSYTDYTGRDCFEIIKQGYIINPLPVVDIIGTTNVYQICESDPVTNDNIEVFDLTSQIPDLLETNLTTPVSNYSVAFYEDMALSIPITNPSSYTNTSNPQTIYVVITNTSSTSGCSSLVGQFNLQVNPKPIIATQLLDFESCDLDGVNDGQTLYDNNPLGLSDYIDDILGATQSASDFTVSFYFNSQLDAEQGNIGSAIQDLATYQVQTGTYWIRVENNLTKCYVLDDFEVVVEKLAEPNLVATTNIACVNWGETTVNNSVVIDSQVTGDYTFEWYADGVLIAGENSATLTVSEIDKDQVEFSVIAISNSSLLCASDTAPSQTKFTIIRSGIAANLQYTVSNAFSEQQIITVSNDGYGIYNYSLDDGPILDNGGVFEDVSFGSHTVYVWDVRDPNGYSCGVQSIQDVQIIDYPHYFTPNGDGIHDTWNIVGLSNQPTAKIYIFDRYGKLLKQISSKGDGWDGTFNGQPLPSTDYWFSVEYLEQNVSKEFKAHFSLKR